MSKNSKISIEIKSEELKAYNEFSKDKGKELPEKLKATFRSLYEENVPEPVRRFVALTDEPEEEKKIRSKKIEKKDQSKGSIIKAPVLKEQSM